MEVKQQKTEKTVSQKTTNAERNIIYKKNSGNLYINILLFLRDFPISCIFNYRQYEKRKDENHAGS